MGGVGVLLAVFSPIGFAQHGSVVADSAHQPAAQQPSAETKFDVPDVTRSAIVFTNYALDVKLETKGTAMRTRAVVTIKNESAAPLDAIPLQISSTLAWEAIESGGKPLPFVHHTVATDADHTGAMNEALVTLPSSLAPAAERTLTVFYAGTLAPSARRLEAIGTPPDLAIHSDWDGVRDEFTGLRGFGNVLWYPVCEVPVRLGDEDRVFTQVGLVKQRQRAAKVSMTVTEETAGAAPTVAFLDGHSVPVRTIAHPAGDDLPNIATATLAETRLGFTTPSLFLARRTQESGDTLKLYARQNDDAATQAYMTAASILKPQMTEWLGAKAKEDLSVLDLPTAEDSPFEERAVLLTSIANVDPKQLLGPMSHVLAHAYFQSPRPWLNEGVAQFMASLWTEHQKGKETAITQLDNLRGALSLAEVGDPDHDAGQPLATAHDPIFYRTKATYVLWMLRGLVGDNLWPQHSTNTIFRAGPLRYILRASAGDDQRAKAGLVFRDWVDRDRGLPDLSVDNVTPSPGSAADSFIVAVTVANAGSAVADVPVTIYSADATVTERMRIEGKGSATHRFLVHGEPEQVQVNDGTTPELEASVHRKDIRYAPLQ